MTAEHVSNFSSPELTRIFSFPASQALRAAAAAAAPSQGPCALPTGLKRLDEALTPSSLGYEVQPPDSTQSQRVTGIPRGHVTEIYGPPGVGKTAVAIKVTANVLSAGDPVVWIDTGSPIPQRRLKAMLTGSVKLAADKSSSLSSSQLDEKIHDCMRRFSYFRAQSLPHLLALLLRPPPGFPAEGTSLLVVDSVSAPFPSYFPNATELKSSLEQGTIADKQQLQWLLNRKWNVTSDMANQLVKLAAARRMAVVLLNQTHTKIRGQPRATLYPALAGGSWESCIHTRVVLYRDWPPEEVGDVGVDRDVLKYVRYAEVMKRAGKALPVRTDDNIVPFLIESDGLREIHKNEHPLQGLASSSPPQASIPVRPPRKRKVEEIADSEDEDEEEEEDGSGGDYGWIESDDAHLLVEEEAEQAPEEAEEVPEQKPEEEQEQEQRPEDETGGTAEP